MHQHGYFYKKTSKSKKKTIHLLQCSTNEKTRYYIFLVITQII